MDTKCFAEIIGHKQIVQALQRAVRNGKVAHAYLFSGPEGIGKYKTASAFAHLLQCTCPDTDKAPQCPACDASGDRAHPDITAILPQGAVIRIEQIRAMQKNVQYYPRAGRRKIFILDGVECLTEQAANSLLKILEEPPPYAVFILLAANIHGVLPTIRSRCQHLSFQTVAQADIVTYLTKQGCDAEQAAVIAAVSAGIPGRALLWAESGNIRRDQVLDCLEDLRRAASGRIWDVVAALDQERGQLLIIFELILFVLRDCLVWKATGNGELLLYQDCAGRIAALAEQAGPDELLALYKELTVARHMLLGNVNSRLLLEKICLNIQDTLTGRGGDC